MYNLIIIQLTHIGFSLYKSCYSKAQEQLIENGWHQTAAFVKNPQEYIINTYNNIVNYIIYREEENNDDNYFDDLTEDTALSSYSDDDVIEYDLLEDYNLEDLIGHDISA